MTCKRCRVPMRELAGHIYHGNRKFRCPQCKRAKMKKPKQRSRSQGRSTRGRTHGDD